MDYSALTDLMKEARTDIKDMVSMLSEMDKKLEVQSERQKTQEDRLNQLETDIIPVKKHVVFVGVVFKIVSILAAGILFFAQLIPLISK